MSRRLLLALLLGGALVASVHIGHGCSPTGNPALCWRDQTRQAVAAVPVTDVVARRTWALG